VRQLTVFLLLPIFTLLFIATITVNQIVSTISSEDLIVGILDDTEFYSYIYDELIPLVTNDLARSQYGIDLGKGDTATRAVIGFDDPDQISSGLDSFINDVISREYVRQEVAQNLGIALTYFRGEQDTFTTDLGFQDRIRAVPEAVDALLDTTQIVDEFVGDVAVPIFGQFNTGVLERAFGLGFREDELEEVVFLLFAPDWIEHHTLESTKSVIPYLAGDADEFSHTVKIEDRVIIAGEIIKTKLRNDDVLYRLVFQHMVGPLLEQAVGSASSVGFGVTLTNQDVSASLEEIAPRQWVRDQGDGIVDELILYLVGAQEEINLTIDLRDRKSDASFTLTELVLGQMKEGLATIPDCNSPQEVEAATRDVVNSATPRCLAGGQESVDGVLSSLRPIMRIEVDNFVAQSIPDELVYSHEYLASIIGGNSLFLDNLRSSISDGIEFDQDDLLNMLAGVSTPKSEAGAIKTIELIADGGIFTEYDVIGGLDDSTLEQIDLVRERLSILVRYRWLIWLLFVIPLLLFVFLISDRWSSRLRMGGTIIALSALIAYMTVTVAWSVAMDRVITPNLPSTVALADSIRAALPQTADEVGSNGPILKVIEIAKAWQKGLKNQAIPWMFLGAIALAFGTGWPSGSTATKPARVAERSSHESDLPDSVADGVVRDSV